MASKLISNTVDQQLLIVIPICAGSEEEPEEDDDKGSSRVLRKSASQLGKTSPPAGNQKTDVKSKLTSMVSGVLSKDRKTPTLKRANSGATSNESSENASVAESPVPSEKSSVYDFDTKETEESVSPSFKKYRSPEKQSVVGLKKPVKRLSKDGGKPTAESVDDSSTAAPVTRLSTKPQVRTNGALQNESACNH